MGPLYCETGHPRFFVAEPINSVTNFVIIALALYAFFIVRKSLGKNPLEYVILNTLFLATGVGSLLWHTLRTPWALILDFLPGGLFLLFFVYLWLRKLYGMKAGVAGLLGFVAVSTATQFLTSSLSLPFFFPLFISALLCGAFFIYLTYRKTDASTALRAVLVLFVALCAAIFRSIDPYTCAYIPVGTHFLWHIFLSTAAFLGVTLLLRLEKINNPSR